MGFVGLTPSEYSSGDTTRRGRITKAGNAHLRTQLVEAAWSYRHHPHVGVDDPRAANTVCHRTSSLGRGTPSSDCVAATGTSSNARSTRNVVVTAIARELAGFVWAEMTAA